MSLPPSANLQKNVLFKWDEFEENVYLKFISLFQLEIESAFNQLQFWLNFTVLDPRKLPETISDVESYGIEEMNELVNFYGIDKKDTYKGESVFQKTDLDKIATLAEFEGFKQTMFEKHKSYREMINVKTVKSTNQDEIKHLRKQSQQYTPSMLYYNSDTVFQELYPNCYKLFYLLVIFPLEVACVERFFSKLKLVKTRLRNQLSQTTLEFLLRIATESTKEGFSDSQYEYFVDEPKKNNPKMKMSL